MTVARQAAFWFAGLVLLGFLIDLFSPILLPFVAGLLIAYFLNPVVEGLERWGASRALAAVFVLAVFFVFFALGLALLIPVVQGQILELATRAPDLVDAAHARFTDALARLNAELSQEDLKRLRSAAATFAGDALAFLAGLLARIWRGGFAIFNALSLVIITPVVAFYMLRDWSLLVAKLDAWLPRQHAATIRGLAHEADEMLSGFVRGMGVVCLILAALYGAALSVIGLDFGLVIGIAAGLISFVPFAGAAMGFLVSVGMAFAQFSEWPPIVSVAAVFIAGQALEGNVLTPKLVGRRIRLHPVWIIFALLAGGALFGFVGVLLAVPVAAVIGVLVRFLVQRYLDSPLFAGPDAEDGTATERREDP